MRSGLIGRAIGASRSPWLHEQEACAQGFPLRYSLFDFDELGLADADLGRFLRSLGDEELSGVNVTFPFKQAVVPLLDAVAESAALVGAVNTVAIRGGRFIGHNTDMSGFRESARKGLAGAPMETVLLLGAGGAGSAVACALLSLGVTRLVIRDVDAARAAALAAALGHRFGAQRVAVDTGDAPVTTRLDGIVNATPIGMAGHPGMPIAADLVLPSHWVADVVYFPLETELLRTARSKGCRVLGGMVVGQAAQAFEIITGRPADASRMSASFLIGTNT